MANCRNTQQLNITCCTDVVLHDKLMFDGEVFDPNVSVDIECNLVNSLGKRTSLEYEIADDVLIIQIPWVEGRNAGCYGLEVKGKCNGKTWATYADSLIRYTRATVEGAAVVETEHDWYDVTQVVSYRYSDSPLDEVDAIIDDNYGEPSVTPTYEHNKLTLDFKNIRGNGIASVEQTAESLEPEGVNETTITQDNGNTTVIRVRNGKSIVGPQGLQGDSAVYNPDDPDAPDFVMANTTGNSTTKAMTQKAVTDALKNATEFTSTEVDFSSVSEQAYYVFQNKWTAASGTAAARRVKMIPVTAGKRYWVENINGISAYYSVFTTNTITAGATPSYATGWTWGKTIDSLFVDIPSDGAYLCLQVHDDDTAISWKVYLVTENAFAEELGDNPSKGVSQRLLTDELNSDREYTSVIIKVNNYFKVKNADGNNTRNVVIASTGLWTNIIDNSNPDSSTSVLLPVKPGQIYELSSTSQSSFHAFFVANGNHVNGTAPTLAGGLTEVPTVNVVGTKRMIVPDDAQYLYIRVISAAIDISPTVKLITTPKEYLSKVDNISAASNTVDISHVAYVKNDTQFVVIADTNKWVNTGTSTTSKAKIISVKPGDVFEVTRNEGIGFHICFLTSNAHTNGTVPSYAGGETEYFPWRIGTARFVAPADAHYMYIRVETANGSSLPTIKLLESVSSTIDVVSNIKDDEEIRDMLKNGVNYTNNTVLNTYGTATSKTNWRLSGYIPIGPGQHTFCFNYGKADSGVSAFALYDNNKNLISLTSASGTGNPIHKIVTDSSSVSFKRYVRLSYYKSTENITGHLVVDGKLVWSDCGLGKGMLPEEEELFIKTSSIKTTYGYGNNATFAGLSFTGLKVGNWYRLIIDNPTPWLSYLSSLTTNQIWGYIQQYPDGNTDSIYAGSPSMPVLSTMDFIARTTGLSLGGRFASMTQVEAKLMGEFTDYSEDVNDYRNEESSLIRNARYISGNQPYVGLLHFSDLHGDQVAANELLKSINYHGTNIDDVLCTGDVVRETADGSVSYPQGTSWWQNCGLASKSLFVIGNHDNATPASTQYDQKENSNAWDGKGLANAIAQYYTPYDNDHGTSYHRADGGCYWYKDYATAKIRLIGLDCMHRFDGIVDPATGEQDGDHAGLKHLTTEQEEWFVARLNETLDSTNAAYGYAVVVSCHFPLDDFSDGSAPNKHWDDTTHEWIYNHETTGGRVMYAKDNTPSNWSYATGSLSLEAKFSLRNRVGTTYPNGSFPNYTKGNTNNFGEILKAWMTRGGNFVVWLCGHMHYDLFYYPTNYPEIPVMTITQAGSYTSTPSASRARPYDRYAANFVSVYNAGTYSVIKVVRLGAKRDVNLAARRYLVYYGNSKNIICEG